MEYASGDDADAAMIAKPAEGQGHVLKPEERGRHTWNLVFVNPPRTDFAGVELACELLAPTKSEYATSRQVYEVTRPSHRNE